MWFCYCGRIVPDNTITDFDFDSVMAKIILIEFSDYDCHNCSQFHNETSREIINDYINSGMIKFLFKDFTISDIANKKHVNTSG